MGALAATLSGRKARNATDLGLQGLLPVDGPGQVQVGGAVVVENGAATARPQAGLVHGPPTPRVLEEPGAPSGRAHAWPSFPFADPLAIATGRAGPLIRTTTRRQA